MGRLQSLLVGPWPIIGIVARPQPPFLPPPSPPPDILLSAVQVPPLPNFGWWLHECMIHIVSLLSAVRRPLTLCPLTLHSLCAASCSS